MELEPESVAVWTRATARLSACAFYAFLVLDGVLDGVVDGFDDGRQTRAAWSRRMLTVFVTLHTIHFGAVLALARATDGENLDQRGGLPAALAGAAAFYGAVGWIARAGTEAVGWRRVTRTLALLALWLVFTQAYVPRALDAAVFAGMTLFAAAALASLVRGSRRAEPSGR